MADRYIRLRDAAALRSCSVAAMAKWIARHNNAHVGNPARVIRRQHGLVHEDDLAREMQAAAVRFTPELRIAGTLATTARRMNHG